MLVSYQLPHSDILIYSSNGVQEKREKKKRKKQRGKASPIALSLCK